MRIIVTAGPTREYIDSVRFITNASSGQMGYAVAAIAVEAGHDLTLLTGPVALSPPPGCRTVRFVTVADLAAALADRFADCDALVMAAAVSDFRLEMSFSGKLRRGAGPVQLRLVPTEDIVAALGTRKRADQTIVTFAVEAGDPARAEARARRKMTAKAADYVVVNSPAAIAAGESAACILSSDGVVLPWAERPKQDLAREIVNLLESTR